MKNEIFLGDALTFYKEWETPNLIISDGPYGLGIFPGEPKSPTLLSEWYEEHIKAWTKFSNNNTTLWIWNSEVGWANIHCLLIKNGWIYRETTIWNKGISHVAGKINSKTIRSLPIVTEIAVRYERPSMFKIDGVDTSIKDWLRNEWLRSGIPLNKSNEACNVKNAATRKYLTKDECWYWPPIEAIKLMAEYCLKYGAKTENPYFNLSLLNINEWNIEKERWNEDVKSKHNKKMRSTWNHQHGLTNVWDYPPLRNSERIKEEKLSFHANQKPEELIKRQIELTTNKGDVVWEPFAGTGTIGKVAKDLERHSFSSEINEKYYNIAKKRII